MYTFHPTQTKSCFEIAKIKIILETSNKKTKNFTLLYSFTVYADDTNTQLSWML